MVYVPFYPKTIPRSVDPTQSWYYGSDVKKNYGTHGFEHIGLERILYFNNSNRKCLNKNGGKTAKIENIY